MTDGNMYREEDLRLGTPESVIELMGGSATAEEWSRNCDVVVASFEGGYPDFWHEAIIGTGLAQLSAAFRGIGQSTPELRASLVEECIQEYSSSFAEEGSSELLRGDQ